MKIAEDWKPYQPPNIIEWVTENIRNPVGGPKPYQPFDWDLSPWTKIILPYTVDPRVRIQVVVKATSTSASSGIGVNSRLYKIANSPRDAITVLPDDDLAKDYLENKLRATILASPKIHHLTEVSVTGTSKRGNTQHVMKSLGCKDFFCGSHSTAKLDSRHVQDLLCDEVDRFSIDSSGQGHALKKAMTRVKAFDNSHVLAIGSPGNAATSQMKELWEQSDQRYFHVPCHKCGDAAPLHDNNIVYDRYTDNGLILPKNVFYCCPFCKSHWGEAEKRANTLNLWEEPTREFNGIVGHYIPGVYSMMENSSMENIIKRYLVAELDAKNGDQNAMKVWVNTDRGWFYEYQSDHDLSVEILKKRESGKSTSCKPYQRGTVPDGVIFLTMATDKQHDRLHVLVCGHGKGGEIWVIDRRIFYSQFKTHDSLDPVWDELYEYESQPFKHSNGRRLFIKISSVDGKDVPQPAYDYVKGDIKLFNKDGDVITRPAYNGTKRIVINGASWGGEDKQIFTNPKKVEFKGSQNNTKLNRHGLGIYQVGTHRAKNELTENLKLDGCGSNRIHFYQGIEDDFCNQLLSEQLIPINPRQQRWVKKSGRPNEDFDTMVYNLHARICVLSTNKNRAENLLAKFQRELNQSDFFEVLEEADGVDSEKKADPAVEIAKNSPLERPLRTRPKVVKRGNSTQFW
jgi:phage terminase large subunit GpA-like protein